MPLNDHSSSLHYTAQLWHCTGLQSTAQWSLPSLENNTLRFLLAREKVKSLSAIRKGFAFTFRMMIKCCEERLIAVDKKKATIFIVHASYGENKFCNALITTDTRPSAYQAFLSIV